MLNHMLCTLSNYLRSGKDFKFFFNPQTDPDFCLLASVVFKCLLNEGCQVINSVFQDIQ